MYSVKSNNTSTAYNRKSKKDIIKVEKSGVENI